MCYYSYALQSNAVRIPSPSVLLYLLCLPPSCSPTLLPILSLFLFFFLCLPPPLPALSMSSSPLSLSHLQVLHIFLPHEPLFLYLPWLLLSSVYHLPISAHVSLAPFYSLWPLLSPLPLLLNIPLSASCHLQIHIPGILWAKLTVCFMCPVKFSFSVVSTQRCIWRRNETNADVDGWSWNGGSSDWDAGRYRRLVYYEEEGGGEYSEYMNIWIKLLNCSTTINVFNICVGTSNGKCVYDIEKDTTFRHCNFR